MGPGSFFLVVKNQSIPKSIPIGRAVWGNSHGAIRMGVSAWDGLHGTVPLGLSPGRVPMVRDAEGKGAYTPWHAQGQAAIGGLCRPVRSPVLREFRGAGPDAGPMVCRADGFVLSGTKFFVDNLRRRCVQEKQILWMPASD